MTRSQKNNYGSSLLKKKTASNIKYYETDRLRVKKIGEIQRNVTIDDIINVNSKVSTIHEEKLDTYLKLKLDLDKKYDSSIYVKSKDNDYYIDYETNEVLDKFSGDIITAKKLFDTHLDIFERPIRYLGSTNRVHAFVQYVGSFIKKYKKKQIKLVYFNVEKYFNQQQRCINDGNHDTQPSVDERQTIELEFDSNEYTNHIEDDSSYSHDSISHDIAQSNISCDSYSKCNNNKFQLDNDDLENSDNDSNSIGSNANQKCTIELKNNYIYDADDFDLIGLKEACKEIATTTNKDLFNSAIFNFFFTHIKNSGPFVDTNLSKKIEQLAYQKWYYNMQTVFKFIKNKEGALSEITPFEKNIEYWRELWKTIERSDVIVQILDSCCPLLFLNKKLGDYIGSYSKVSVTLLNKIDRLSYNQQLAWKEFFEKEKFNFIMYSALNELTRLEEKERKYDSASFDNCIGSQYNGYTYKQIINYFDKQRLEILAKENDAILNIVNIRKLLEIKIDELYSDNVSLISTYQDIKKLLYYKYNDCILTSKELEPPSNLLDFFIGRPILQRSTITIGMVGFPNVGKSSLINTLLQKNAYVRVSRIPGKTKNIQTHRILNTNLIVCDCPGIILPVCAANKEDLVINSVLNFRIYRNSLVNCVKNILIRAWEQVVEYHNIEDIAYKIIYVERKQVADVTETILYKIAKSRGYYKTGKGGLLDIEKTCRMIIENYIGGKLYSYCEMPPNADEVFWIMEEKKKWEEKRNVYLTKQKAQQ